MSKDITASQWLIAIEQAQDRRTDDSGMTTCEIAELLGVSEKKCRKIIREQMDKGLVTRVNRLIENIAGHPQYVITYKIIPAKKK